MKTWSILLILFFCMFACKKDVVPLPAPDSDPEPTIIEKIVGNYKVYDTLGTFLYDMSISHSSNPSIGQDSLIYYNFDGQFYFSAVQSSSIYDPEFVIIYGYQSLLYDSLEKRWKIYSSIDGEYNNV